MGGTPQNGNKLNEERAPLALPSSASLAQAGVAAGTGPESAGSSQLPQHVPGQQRSYLDMAETDFMVEAEWHLTEVDSQRADGWLDAIPEAEPGPWDEPPAEC